MYLETIQRIAEVCPLKLKERMLGVVRRALFLDAAELENAHAHGLLSIIPVAADVQKCLSISLVNEETITDDFLKVARAAMILIAMALLRSQNVDVDPLHVSVEREICQQLNYVLYENMDV